MRGSVIMFIASGALLGIGYFRAASGASAGDSRLAAGGAFLAALTLVMVGLRGVPRLGHGGAGGVASVYALAGLAVAVGLLAFVARAASPLWHGTFIAGWAGVMAGLAAASLFRPGPR